jgi:hypothetical protein
MPEIITRREARDRGLKRYFTGGACKRGHIADRWVSMRNCVDCVRLRYQTDCDGESLSASRSLVLCR